MDQRTDEWLRQRAGKFTGSRFGDLMARTKTGPSASRNELITTLAIERILGDCLPTYSNAAMQRGVELEPMARAAYEAHIGDLIEECAWVPHPRLPNVGVSPDGLVGANGLVELKCPANPAKHLAAIQRDEHAQEYSWQLQGQLWVTGRDWVDAVSFDPRFPEPLRLHATRVERDEAAIKALIKECVAADAEVEAIVADLRKRMPA
jgi:putative phage-type endonuclease